MYGLDIMLNKRLHQVFTKHYFFSALALVLLINLCLYFPQLNLQLLQPNALNPMIKLGIGLLLYDSFVYFMHRYIEHGIFWRWHQSHHQYVYDDDLSYYSPAPVGPEETLYYTSVQVGIAYITGMNAIEMFILISWIFQQGAYIHQKGLPDLPWPLLSPKHHRTHHFKAKRYYSGLFLFWDKLDDIDPRAIKGLAGHKLSNWNKPLFTRLEIHNASQAKEEHK